MTIPFSVWSAGGANPEPQLPDGASAERILFLERRIQELEAKLARKEQRERLDQAAQTVGGTFYIVRLDPIATPCRIKFGWAKDPVKRLSKHRTAAPRAELLGYWECERSRERKAITRLTHRLEYNCQRISDECYDVDDVEAMMDRARSYFGRTQFLAADWPKVVLKLADKRQSALKAVGA